MAAKRIAKGVLAAVLCLLLAAPAVLADPRGQFLEAEACYRKLRQNPGRQKYREPWLQCIGGFEAVHRADPDGAWAAAGLYMAGSLYLELARRSHLAADRQEGMDRLQRIVKRHPGSAYRPKAEAAMAATASDKPSIKNQSRRLDPKSAEIGRIQGALTALSRDADKRRYRHHWQKLIDASLAVYRRDPAGPAAAAALYTAGRLYHEMAAVSRIEADRREAADFYSRVIRQFPTSAYAVEARTQSEQLSGVDPPSSVTPPADARAAEMASARFRQAESGRKALMGDPSQQKYRERWQKVIDAYLGAAAADPAGPAAAEALYHAGTLYLGLHQRSFRESDRDAGVQILDRIVRDFPDGRFRESAKTALATAGPALPGGSSAAAAGADPLSSVIEAAAATPGSPAAAPAATVSGLRYWSNPRYTRVVIDADQDTAFSHRLLGEDLRLSKPHRLFVDLERCRLGPEVARIIPINDDLLSDARAGQNTADTVRVVIDIKSFRNYKVFSLKNPFRVVIDVWGDEKAQASADAAPAAPAATPPASGKKLPAAALAKQLSLGVNRIIIDPGHGGKDYGAPGYYKNVHEKVVVLSLAKRLAEMIRTEIGCEAVLTRTGDTYLPLEERTAFANTRSADLFISIHTNAARDQRAYGIETYFLNLATDDDAIQVAALENATSTKNISDLQAILSDLMQNAKINESSRLAAHIQDNMTKGLKRHYGYIKSKGVKQAPFYVLLGAQMPSVLVETSFISNPRECKRLTDPAYQKQICQGIVDGIKAYIEEAKPSAFHFGGGDGKG